MPNAPSGLPASATALATAWVRIDPSWGQAFASAIVRPGGQALLINRDNTRGRWLPIPEAVALGTAFLVEVADDILALDADIPALAALVPRVTAGLKGHGLQPVLIASGRDGHHHLLCRIPDRSLFLSFKKRASSMGLDVRRAIRPPGSPHRQGLPVYLIEPPDPPDALSALSTRAVAGTPSSLREWLSVRMANLLRFGDKGSCYHSRSELVLALGLAARNAGWPERRFFAAMVDPRNKGGEKIREIVRLKGEPAAKQYVGRCWVKADLRVLQAPPIRDTAAAMQRLERIGRLAEAQVWRGTGGASAWAVLRAHVTLARRVGKLTHDLSVRETAELAGVCISTVSRARRRLVASGWLQRSASNRQIDADTWVLHCPPQRGTRRNTLISLRGCEACVPDGSAIPSATDAWRWCGLGKSALRVWRLLDQPQTTGELATRLGLTARAVRKHLTLLQEYQLATRDTGLCWKRGPGEPDRVAEALGVAGEGGRQRARHEAERQAFRLTHRVHSRVQQRNPEGEDHQHHGPDKTV